MEYISKEEHNLKSDDISERKKENIPKTVNLTGLPKHLKNGIESLSGLKMDDVRVHYGSLKPQQFQALAYTQGNDIHISSGEEKHLPHEAWHVIQQKQGRVKETLNKWNMPINDDQTLEQEADQMGEKALNTSFPAKFLLDQKIGNRNIIQRVNVKVKDKIDTEAPVLEKKMKPTMVFESMGDESNIDPIFSQAKAYTGNSICIYGVNKRHDALDGNSDLIKPPDQIERRHFLRNFTFEWKKPLNVLETAPYIMPFIEARTLVMRQAQEITNTLSDREEPWNQFIYRWIDADARNDTSNNISKANLNEFADKVTPKLGTGIYNWRSESKQHDPAGSKKVYRKFVSRINFEERKLREWYWSVIDKTKISGESGDVLEPLNYPKYRDSNYLPGAYLPEPTFLMNQAAHDNILITSFASDSEQSKESMKIAEKSGVEFQDVQFFDRLAVSKPLKHENRPVSYFFNAKMRTFVNEPYNKDLLINALGGLRQSIFDRTKWFFKNAGLNEMLNGKRTEAILRLEMFLLEQVEGRTNFSKLRLALPV